jgi:hypothetical protein
MAGFCLTQDGFNRFCLIVKIKSKIRLEVFPKLSGGDAIVFGPTFTFRKPKFNSKYY